MKFVHSLQRGDLPGALRRAADAVESGLGGARVDLLVLFTAGYARDEVAAGPALLRGRFDGATVVGSSSTAVSAGGETLEDEPGISLLGASLPDVQARAAVIEPAASAPLQPEVWSRALGFEADLAPALVVLAVGGSLDLEPALLALDQAYPYSPKVGALVPSVRDDAALFADGFVHRRGALVLGLAGDLAMDVVVAQGARAVGPAFVVTGAQGNVITSLDGRSALEVFAEVVAGRPGAERLLMQRQPQIGVSSTGPSDWLVRDVLGAHPPTGSLVVGFAAEAGQHVRFHLRDAASARDDLAAQLRGWRAAHPEAAAGALQFSCVGRGRPFYGQPDVDAAALAAACGGASAGCFAAGELAPFRGFTLVHAYTSAIGLFRPAGWN